MKNPIRVIATGIIIWFAALTQVSAGSLDDDLTRNPWTLVGCGIATVGNSGCENGEGAGLALIASSPDEFCPKYEPALEMLEESVPGLREYCQLGAPVEAITDLCPGLKEERALDLMRSFMPEFMQEYCERGVPPEAKGKWVLAGYGAPNEVRAACHKYITVSFVRDTTSNGNFMGGRDGCNSYSMDYMLVGTTLELGDRTSTMVYCGPASTQEKYYFSTLGLPLTLEVNDDQMILSGGDRVLVFARRDEAGVAAATDYTLLPAIDCP